MDEKIKNILRDEFTLEILLKQRELSIITEEIKRGEELLNLLKQIIVQEQIVLEKSSLEPLRAGLDIDSQLQLAMRASESASIPATDHKLLALPQKTKKEPKVLYDIKPDGSFVKLVCPTCKKELFANSLGLTNHCRIVHSLTFSSLDDRLEKCGIPVPESEVPDKVKEKASTSVMMKYEKDLALLRQRTEFDRKAPETRIVEYDTNNEESKQPNELKDSEHTSSNPLMVAFGHLIEGNKQNDDSCNSHSRFYVEKQLSIQCYSKKITANDLEPNITHKWKLVISEAQQDESKRSNDISSYISHIKATLHDSYKPFNEEILYPISVDDPQSDSKTRKDASCYFKLSRKCWGTSSVRLQLFFVDSVLNKPVTIFHSISISGKKNTYTADGTPRRVPIEIDKNSKNRNYPMTTALLPDEPSKHEDDTNNPSENTTGNTANSSTAADLIPSRQKRNKTDRLYCKYCGSCNQQHLSENNECPLKISIKGCNTLTSNNAILSSLQSYPTYSADMNDSVISTQTNLITSLEQISLSSSHESVMLGWLSQVGIGVGLIGAKAQIKPSTTLLLFIICKLFVKNLIKFTLDKNQSHLFNNNTDDDKDNSNKVYTIVCSCPEGEGYVLLKECMECPPGTVSPSQSVVCSPCEPPMLPNWNRSYCIASLWTDEIIQMHVEYFIEKAIQLIEFIQDRSSINSTIFDRTVSDMRNQYNLLLKFQISPVLSNSIKEFLEDYNDKGFLLEITYPNGAEMEEEEEDENRENYYENSIESSDDNSLQKDLENDDETEEHDDSNDDE